MQAIMETLFEIPYLVGVILIGILMVRKSKIRRGFMQYEIFGAMAIVLGFGDAFHLLPRMYALWTDGIAAHPASLGFGKLVTSITMTIFYVMLYRFWAQRYNKTDHKSLSFVVYALAAVRIVLCLFPQNMWLSANSPLSWGIYRNIPFVILGAVIIALFFREAKNDRSFKNMWLAITLSFLFYIPVVLFADMFPMIGMLMLPKTCAYVWMIWMGWRDLRTNLRTNTKKEIAR